MAHWSEHTPPTNVAQVKIPATTLFVNCGLSLLLVRYLALRSLFPVLRVFPSLQKPTLSDWTRNEEEPLRGYATFKSLLFIIVILLRRISQPAIALGCEDTIRFSNTIRTFVISILQQLTSLKCTTAMHTEGTPLKVLEI